MISLHQLQRYQSLVESLVQSSKPASIALATDRRAVYRPLRLCTCLQSMAQSRTIDREILGEIDQLDDHPMSAMAFYLAGELFDRHDLTKASERIFNKLIAEQRSTGEFLPPDPNANLESRWYEELILLHAVAGYAARVRDDAIRRAVENSALFHFNETQPDHATTEPWGLLAFIQHAPPMADQILHSLTMQYPAGVTGIPLLLLRDVLYGLAELTMENKR